MLLYKDIVKDGNEVLRLKANDVLIPLSNEDKQTLKDMHEYLANGYDEEFVKKVIDIINQSVTNWFY